MPLRFTSYLAPSIPLELHRGVCDFIERQLGLEATLASDGSRSGPSVDDNPFVTDETDVAFLCAPSFYALSQPTPPLIELLGAAPLPDDPRCDGRPVYFSDVVVHRDSPWNDFRELHGARWAYNDPASLSGRHSVYRHVAALGLADDFVGEGVAVGSHLRALDAVSDRLVDYAAIDSNTLLLERRRRPEVISKLRVVASLGPHPVQPVVVRADLPADLKRNLTAALLACHEDPQTARCLHAHGVVRFVPVGPDDYTREAIFGLASADSAPPETRPREDAPC